MDIQKWNILGGGGQILVIDDGLHFITENPTFRTSEYIRLAE